MEHATYTQDASRIKGVNVDHSRPGWPKVSQRMHQAESTQAGYCCSQLPVGFRGLCPTIGSPYESGRYLSTTSSRRGYRHSRLERVRTVVRISEDEATRIVMI